MSTATTDSSSWTPTTTPAKQQVAHPLAALSAAEISATAQLVKGAWPAQTDIHFKVVTLQEPPKAEVVPYLEAEHSGGQRPTIARKAFVNYYIRNTVSLRPGVESIWVRIVLIVVVV